MYIIRNESLNKLEELPYFNLMAVRQLFGFSAATARQTLARWNKAGKIIRIKKNCYLNRNFYLTHYQDPDWPGFLSAIIQPFSYLSLEYALQQRGIITETTYPVTAVTVKNTSAVTNRFGEFIYRHLKPALFGGYNENYAWGVTIKTAGLGKALFDYLYFRRGLDLELRLNWEEFTPEEIKDYNYWVKASRSESIPLWKQLSKN